MATSQLGIDEQPHDEEAQLLGPSLSHRQAQMPPSASPSLPLPSAAVRSALSVLSFLLSPFPSRSSAGRRLSSVLTCVVCVAVLLLLCLAFVLPLDAERGSAATSASATARERRGGTDDVDSSPALHRADGQRGGGEGEGVRGWPSDGPLSPALSSLPLCRRTLSWSLISWSGFGSQLSSTLSAASFAALTSRSFFVDSTDFAYGPWRSFSTSALMMREGGYAIQEDELSQRMRRRRSHSSAATEARPVEEEVDFAGIIGRPAPVPSSSSAPPLRPVNGSLPVPVVWSVEELLDQWPILGAVPHPTSLSALDSSIAPSFDEFVQWSGVQREGVESALSDVSSLCHVEVDPYALLSPERSTSPLLPLCRAPASSRPHRPYDWPPLFPSPSTASAARKAGNRSSALLTPHVQATLVDDDDGCFPALHCAHGMELWRRSALQPSTIDATPKVQAQVHRLLAPLPALFFWHRRTLRSLLTLRASIRCHVQRLMDRWRLTPKLDFANAQHRSLSRQNLTGLIAPAAAVAAAAAHRLRASPISFVHPSTASSPAPTPLSRFVCVHVRRGDKAVELEDVTKAEFGDLERYVVAVERVAERDERLRRSWPTMSAGNCTDPSLFSFAVPWAASMCKAWWRLQEEGQLLQQPHVVVVSDDAAAFHGLLRARPCWQWLTPSLHERWDVVEGRWREREEGAAAGPSVGWVEGGGHEQWQFNSRDAAVRESATHSLLVELSLLSVADHAVVTLSSNIGRTAMLSRGAWDALVEQRLTSVDEPVEQWRPW